MFKKTVSPKKNDYTIGRSSHNVSRKAIDTRALKVLYRLHGAGYAAYLVGGCVRDLLHGLTPKDFDVVTDAKPEQVKKLFRNCRIIGRRFRLAHICFGPTIIEVATFRQASESPARSAQGLLLCDNAYGSLEEDVVRRDFTVNALYYNIADFSILDRVGGIADLTQGVLRMMGDPVQRYREDPARMLRAVRFSARLGLTLEEGTATPLTQLGPLLATLPQGRLYDECLKVLQMPQAATAYALLKHYALLPFLLSARAASHSAFSEQGLKHIEAQVLQGQRRSSAFLFALLLWHCFEHKMSQRSTLSRYDQIRHNARAVLKGQVIAIPKRVMAGVEAIWWLQWRLPRITPKRLEMLRQAPRFSSAYQLLQLRGHTDHTLEPWVQAWSA